MNLKGGILSEKVQSQRSHIVFPFVLCFGNVRTVELKRLLVTRGTEKEVWNWLDQEAVA